MPRYMLKARYTADGAQGLLKDGGTARRAAVEKLLQSVGGRLEAMYFAFGEDDVFVIADLPELVTAAAAALTVSSSGAVGVSTIVLLTPEEIDQATHKAVDYTAPGR